MNLELLEHWLQDKGLLRGSAGASLKCVCVFCGDHPDDQKKGHLYLTPEKNLYHCFLCGRAGIIPNLISKFSGDKKLISEIFTKGELTQKLSKGGVKVKKTRQDPNINIPKIDHDSFVLKRAYVKNRVGFLDEPERISGLVFDINKFVVDNFITLPQDMSLDFLQSNCVGFLSHRKSLLMCRNIDVRSKMKFFKIPIEEDPYKLLDYYCLKGRNPISNTIVMAEGAFDVLGEFYANSLGIKDDVRLYVAAFSADSMSSVLKAVCFDNQLFNIDLVILSDRDKEPWFYKKLIKNSKHVLKSLKIYYNKSGKDFGEFPLKPVLGGDLKSVTTKRKNKKSF